ncbi:MAG: hypothetical protein ACO3ZW_06610 [Opitutales bacterium]|jgi:uncharacterized alkaline shock family protein YloU
MQTLSEYLGYLLKPPYMYYAVVAIVMLVTLYVIYTYRRATQGIVPFKTQGGTIEIAPSTLRSVMQHAASSVDGVEKAHCRHFLKGRRVGVKVAIHLQANHRLKDVEADIKHRIRATLYEQFGMETIEPINIRLTRIVGDPVATDSLRGRDYTELQAGLVDIDEDSDDRPYAEETRL